MRFESRTDKSTCKVQIQYNVNVVFSRQVFLHANTGVLENEVVIRIYA